MRSLGKVDCRSLGNQKLVLQATAEDGTAADVRMDAEGNILVTEDFRGWVDLQAGGRRSRSRWACRAFQPSCATRSRQRLT